MIRRNLAVVAAIVVAAALLTFAFFSRTQTRDDFLRDQLRSTTMASNLGVTYMAVTPGISAYYKLNVDSGALVTEVANNSAADRGGLRVGDIILKYNGKKLDEGEPLLGMMMTCPQGSTIELEVWRGGGTSTLNLIHGDQ